MTSEQPKDTSLEAIRQSLPEKRDFSDLKDRITSIMRTVSGKPDLIVTTEVGSQDIANAKALGQDAQNAWYRTELLDPVTRKHKGEYVHIPEKILEANENIVKGSAAHEAGHVAISRMGRFIPDKIIQEPGFHQFIAAIEERPTDQVVRDRYAGAGRWVDELRRDQANRGRVAAETKTNVGYLPKSMQMSNFIVFSPHLDKPPLVHSEDVKEIYDRVREYVEAVEHILPPEGAREEDIVAHAKERYKIAYKKVWPEVKKLVEQDLKTEGLRQMVNEKKDKGAMEQLMEALEDELKKELESAMSGPHGEPTESQGDAKKESEKQESSKEKGEQSEDSEGAESETSPPPGFGTPIPMDTLSQKLLDALDRAFKSLPEATQKELEDRARRVLEAMEDKMVKELQGKLEEMPLQTHEEYHEEVLHKKEEAQRHKEAEEEKKLVEHELRAVERKLMEAQQSTSLYEKTYQQIQKQDEELYRLLEEIFTPNIKRTMRLTSSGAKINLPAVFRWEAGRNAGAKALDNRIFEATHLPEKKDYAFVILNDLSASMQIGYRIENDFKGKMLLAEVLNRLGVRTQLMGFHDHILMLKGFREELTDAVRSKMESMLSEVHKGRWTNTGMSLREASADLAGEPAKEKFLIVITDGLPQIRGMNSLEAAKELHDAVKHILGATDQKLIGLGLGVGTAFVKKFFPASVADIFAEELPRVLGDLLPDMIRNPQNYSYQKGNR